jgi:uncharacterized membrane protein
MITVTGLVFALTIVALQIASGQYSPRLLRNFMRDRGTQLVLSIFVGAFAYSTAGLYTVGVQGSGEEAFVPRLAVSGSLALALASVGVLIYFIHHLAHSIQIDTIMSQVEREAVSVIDDVYPYWPRYREPEERCPEPPMEAVSLPAGRSGFERTMVQDVGFGIRRLVDIANKALSPAINDPYTGVQAVQHLSVGHRGPPSRLHPQRPAGARRRPPGHRPARRRGGDRRRGRDRPPPARRGRQTRWGGELTGVSQSMWWS